MNELLIEWLIDDKITELWLLNTNQTADISFAANLNIVKDYIIFTFLFQKL